MTEAIKTEWVTRAINLIGVREIPGPRHNSIIQGWLKKLGAWWSDDETPWCGVFAAHCMAEAGQPYPKAYYRAKSWADWGRSVMALPKLKPGTVLVFGRDGGGHVGFYVGEDPQTYHVLGGNQGNRVCVSKIAKTRLIAARWPLNVAYDAPLNPRTAAVLGAWQKEADPKLSMNEA